MLCLSCMFSGSRRPQSLWGPSTLQLTPALMSLCWTHPERKLCSKRCALVEVQPIYFNSTVWRKWAKEQKASRFYFHTYNIILWQTQYLTLNLNESPFPIWIMTCLRILIHLIQHCSVPAHHVWQLLCVKGQAAVRAWPQVAGKSGHEFTSTKYGDVFCFYSSLKMKMVFVRVSSRPRQTQSFATLKKLV